MVQTARTKSALPAAFHLVGVLGGIFIALLSPSTGMVNYLLKKMFGIQPVYFMARTVWWPVMFVLSGIWQSAGLGYDPVWFIY